MPLVSIGVSILTIGYSATIVCFDFDLDPEKRIQTPKFYGYIPTSSRGRFIVFLVMFLFSTCHILLKIVGLALLVTLNSAYVCVFLGVDMAIYFCFKLSRQDLRYWLRLDGAWSWIVSILIRFFVKILVDFTTIVHMRVSSD